MKFSLFVLTITLMACVYAEDLDKLKSDLAKHRADEVSNWAASYLADYLKVPGDYYLQKVTNVKPQIGQTNEFKMQLEIAIKQKSGDVLYKTCDIEVTDSAITNSRWFKSNNVKCVDNNKQN